MSQPENDLKKAITAALRACGYLVMRNEIGARRNKRMGLGLGSSDLVVILRPAGRFVALEVKTDSGKVSDAQIAWAANLRDHGGAYYVVRSVREAVEVVTRERLAKAAS